MPRQDELAETAPEIIENPDAARGLKQALTEAMLACLNTTGVREDTAARRRHAAIIRRFRALTEAQAGQALYLTDVCKGIGVNERTLFLCCQEQLGVSPKRYLLLRRLQLARQALRTAASATGSVTEIATRYGFWELGRFAVCYQARVRRVSFRHVEVGAGITITDSYIRRTRLLRKLHSPLRNRRDVMICGLRG